jgi:hypothetical protein
MTRNDTRTWCSCCAVVSQVYVGEPNVPDTIQILRGLKEKYEDHHGVHITDRALVVAAELSDRYITARFLPDKVSHERLWGVGANTSCAGGGGVT